MGPLAQFVEEKLSSMTMYEGKIVRVTLDTVTQPDGTSTTREVVHHNGGAAIIALNDKNEVALIHQYRYAVGREMIEIPAGKIEQCEEPMTTAARMCLAAWYPHAVIAVKRYFCF